MGIFKLPVINIGGRRGGGGTSVPVGTPITPATDWAAPTSPSEKRERPGGGGDSPSSPPKISIDIPRTQQIAGARFRREEAAKQASKSLSYTDIPTLMLDNAKEVIARCIQAGIIGDSAARDYFRSYSTYLDSEPSDGYRDFLDFAFADNEEQYMRIAGVLNSSLDYPLSRLEVDPSKIASGLNGVLEGDLLNLCQKMRVPALTASTTDLVVLGVANPYLARHVEAAFKTELVGQENSYRFFVLLSPSQFKNALGKHSAAGKQAAAGQDDVATAPEGEAVPSVVGIVE
jgi:hypothetical protein